MTAVGFLLLRAAVALGLAWVAGQCYVAGGPVYVLFARRVGAVSVQTWQETTTRVNDRLLAAWVRREAERINAARAERLKRLGIVEGPAR
jgi:hypothetical protein